jgi:chromate reductase
VSKLSKVFFGRSAEVRAAQRTPPNPSFEADLRRQAGSSRSTQTLGVMKVLAISGSLRAASINSALLRTAARLAPPEVEVTLCSVVGDLPLFNPDLESHPPSSVERLRAEVKTADALLIASPEYAHGVTGTIKNTLDWLVSFESFVNKPVAMLNASPRAHHADSALRETLKTMSAVIVESASVSIPLLGTNITESGMAESPSIAQAIRDSLAALYGVVVLQPSEHGPAFPVDPR